MSDILSLERTEVAVTEPAGSAAVAAVSAPSACATSERRSGTYWRSSTLHAAQQGQFPWAAEASAFSQGCQWLQLEH